jgi:ABC-type thiamin/hydroxymethylpyrimidine transport system permease subunit
MVKLSVPSMGNVEWVSIIGAVVGVALWQKTGNALLAIICAQVAVLAGAIPTFVGAFNHPAQEDPLSWGIWFVSCVCAMIAIRKWDMASVLQPLTFTIIETTMVVLVIVRPLLF